MSALIVQTSVGTIGLAATQTLSFASPVTAGNLIVLDFFTINNGVAGISQVRFNSAVAPIPFVDETADMITQQIWSADGGEQYVQVTPVSPPLTEWAVAVLEIDGEAHIPPYPLNSNSGSSGSPETADPWVAADDGLALGAVAMPTSITITEPSGWTLLGSWQGFGLSAALAWDTITAGAHSAESWVL